MKNVKYFLYSLSRKKMFFIMSVFQITLCLTSMFSMYIDRNYSIERINNAVTFYKNKNIYQLTSSGNPTKNITIEDVKSLSQRVKSMKNAEYITFNQEATAAKFSKILQSHIIEGQEGAPDYLGEKIALLPSQQVNNAFIKATAFPLLQGSWDSVKNYDMKSIEVTPVVLGYDYSKDFKVGDTIEYINPRTKKFSKLLVTGILKKGAEYCTNYFNKIMTDMDDTIFYPIITPETFDNIDESQAYLYANNYFNVQVLVNSDLDKFKSEIKALGKKYGYRISVIEPTKEAEKEKSELKGIASQRQLITYIITVFSIISLVVALYSNILKNYREFGIHILLGCKKTDIYKRILYEVFFITAISTVLTVLIVKKFYAGTENYKLLNSHFYMLIIFAALLAGIISAVPMLQVKKLKLNKMIRGDE